MTRRELLWLASSGLLARPGFSTEGPQNLSYPLRSLDGSVTPPNLFFVRDHFTQPEVSIETWKLRIEGRVAHPYELTFSDLVELPSKKVEAVLECAGNAVNGSAVSNGVWEGLQIGELLTRAQPLPGAALVMLEGADSGSLLESGAALPYCQLVPLSKCLDDSSLIAYKLNDRLLPARHGFPARALFPGWYAMDSVKWLRRMVVLDASDRDVVFYRSGIDRLYNRVTVVGDSAQIARVSGIQVKSAVAWPGPGAKLPATRHSVWGFAWSGAGAVRNVAVSTDAGKTWKAAALERQASPYSWVRWSYAWDAAPGEYVLMSCATDAGGHQQPLERDSKRKDGYELNWCMPVHCSVR